MENYFRFYTSFFENFQNCLTLNWNFIKTLAFLFKIKHVPKTLICVYLNQLRSPFYYKNLSLEKFWNISAKLQKSHLSHFWRRFTRKSWIKQYILGLILASCKSYYTTLKYERNRKTRSIFIFSSKMLPNANLTKWSDFDSLFLRGHCDLKSENLHIPSNCIEVHNMWI